MAHIQAQNKRPSVKVDYMAPVILTQRSAHDKQATSSPLTTLSADPYFKIFWSP